eukprot:1180852-Prorocentrum_minimum.AAC.3
MSSGKQRVRIRWRVGLCSGALTRQSGHRGQQCVTDGPHRRAEPVDDVVVRICLHLHKISTVSMRRLCNMQCEYRDGNPPEDRFLVQVPNNRTIL